MVFNSKKQKGFSILAVILVIVAVIIAIGIWALSGQSNVSNNSAGSTDIIVEGMINDATAIKSSIVAHRIANGRVNLDNGSFIFERPTVNPKLIRSGATTHEGKWAINPSNFFGSEIGHSSNEDIVVLLGGITDTMCKKINYQLHGKSFIVMLNLSSGTPSVINSSASGFAYNYLSLHDSSDARGWSQGCINEKNVIDSNIFFMVAIPQ